jgi:hypothetical protein
MARERHLLAHVAYPLPFTRFNYIMKGFAKVFEYKTLDVLVEKKEDPYEGGFKVRLVTIKDSVDNAAELGLCYEEESKMHSAFAEITRESAIVMIANALKGVYDIDVALEL